MAFPIWSTANMQPIDPLALEGLSTAFSSLGIVVGQLAVVKAATDVAGAIEGDRTVRWKVLAANVTRALGAATVVAGTGTVVMTTFGAGVGAVGAVTVGVTAAGAVVFLTSQAFESQDAFFQHCSKAAAREFQWEQGKIYTLCISTSVRGYFEPGYNRYFLHTPDGRKIELSYLYRDADDEKKVLERLNEMSQDLEKADQQCGYISERKALGEFLVNMQRVTADATAPSGAEIYPRLVPKEGVDKERRLAKDWSNRTTGYAGLCYGPARFACIFQEEHFGCYYAKLRFAAYSKDGWEKENQNAYRMVNAPMVNEVVNRLEKTVGAPVGTAPREIRSKILDHVVNRSEKTAGDLSAVTCIPAANPGALHAQHEPPPEPDDAAAGPTDGAQITMRIRNRTTKSLYPFRSVIVLPSLLVVGLSI
eukprot:COSAG02_NODE_5714_length_4100_cov_9.621939_4_plen_421_part_00